MWERFPLQKPFQTNQPWCSPNCVAPYSERECCQNR
uniref:Uncharacterized protein n=1 Tax=Anguilla anguilla TaxID=7936 RepID=A0A0E9TB86_ANGAN